MKHPCYDGTTGACDSMKGHSGRHTCDHCQTLFSMPGEPGSLWCSLPCPECQDSCRRTLPHEGRHVCGKDHTWDAGEEQIAAVRPAEFGDVYCPHCYKITITSKTKPCYCCFDYICENCDESNCPKLAWCSHCGKEVRKHIAPKCPHCGYCICDNCSQRNCPKAPTVQCAHCGATISAYSSKCYTCGYCVCEGCYYKSCPKSQDVSGKDQQPVK